MTFSCTDRILRRLSGLALCLLPALPLQAATLKLDCTFEPAGMSMVPPKLSLTLEEAWLDLSIRDPRLARAIPGKIERLTPAVLVLSWITDPIRAKGESERAATGGDRWSFLLSLAHTKPGQKVRATLAYSRLGGDNAVSTGQADGTCTASGTK